MAMRIKTPTPCPSPVPGEGRITGNGGVLGASHQHTPISRIKSHSIAYGFRRGKKNGKMGYSAAFRRRIAHFPDLFPALPEGRAGPGVDGGRERHHSARKY